MLRPAVKNYILNALPADDFNRLRPDLEPIEMPQKKILFSPQQPISDVHFPDTAMISVMTMTAEGKSVEAGVIGAEGISSFNVLMGVDSMPNENMVQLPGRGWRISAAALKREFDRGGRLQQLTLLFIHALLGQVAQSVLCNRVHGSEQRLAKWLLSHDARR